jgi:hypothetical protein
VLNPRGALDAHAVAGAGSQIPILRGGIRIEASTARYLHTRLSRT